MDAKNNNMKHITLLIWFMVLGISEAFLQPGKISCLKTTSLKQQAALRVVSTPVRNSQTSMNFSPLDISFGSSMLNSVDAWSVQSLDANDLASTLFGASLFPYLVFLFFIGKEEVDTPKLANFGFKFLLFFVFATIPAGIAAKVVYNDILANVDWLHGLSESMLTLTNLFIAIGFRQAMKSENEPEEAESNIKLKSPFVASAISLALVGLPSLILSANPEPANALSIPTWIIHVSSLIEWLASMALVWQYAEFTGNPKWKGLTWGMLPLHASGLCACTFHIFYNRPAYYSLVALQAALTCFGNSTLALAGWRIFNSTKEESEIVVAAKKGFVPESFESDSVFFTKLLLLSTVGAFAVKYGEVFFNFPFEDDNLWIALLMIFGPTALNIAKWNSRSGQSESA